MIEALTSIPLDGQLQTNEGETVASWTYVKPSERSLTGEIMIVRRTGSPVTQVGFLPVTVDNIIKFYHWIEDNRQFKVVDVTPAPQAPQK